MKDVKFLVLFTICTSVLVISNAQIKPPAVTVNPIHPELEKVVKDYFNHFMNIRGEEIGENPQSTEYYSSVKITGAEECSITKYSSTKNEIWSWQAVMLTTEEFEKANKKFKALYSQMNNLAVNFEDQSACSFKGDYETPTEAKKFTSVVFSAKTKNETLKPLRIELTLEYKLVEWEIKILVYGKEREDNEQGKTHEG
jgi:hypothetical protein